MRRRRRARGSSSLELLRPLSLPLMVAGLAGGGAVTEVGSRREEGKEVSIERVFINTE